jgi:MFS family permease
MLSGVATPRITLPPASGEYRTSGKWLVAGSVMIGTFLSVMDATVVNVAMPHTTGSFGQDLLTIARVSTAYGVRALFNLLSIPVRQSYLMGVIDPAERSSASGFANFPSQVTSSIGPYLAGYFMEHLALALPLEFAAAMQGLNTLLYWIFLRNVYPPEELGAGATK